MQWIKINFFKYIKKETRKESSSDIEILNAESDPS